MCPKIRTEMECESQPLESGGLCSTQAADLALRVWYTLGLAESFVGVI